MKQFVLATTAAVMLPVLAQAASVDLSGWTENGLRGNNNAGTWTVQGTNNDSVVQSINGLPTVFFDPTSTGAQGTALKGSIKVETTADDDFIGFVLGYSDGEMNSNAADFWLIDWKQNTQPLGIEGTANAGLALTHVSGDIAATTLTYGGLWGKTGVASEKQRGANLGSTGWADNTEYTFDIEFTANLIQVKVNGVTELTWTNTDNGGTFGDGAFGFYNSSQNAVRYAGITSEVAPSIPLPAGLPLMLAGLGAFGWMRRKQRS